MRIAIDARPLQSNSRLRGVGTYTRNLIQNLLDEGKDITLLVWGGTSHNLSTLSQQMYLLPLPRIRVLGFAADRYLHNEQFLALADQVDLVHFTSPFELDMSWPGVDLGIPRIVTVHDLMPITHPSLILEGKHKLLQPVYTKQADWLRSADGILANSETTSKTIAEIIPDAPETKTVLLGASHSLSRPLDKTISDFRAKFQLPEQFVLYFGGLSRNKNVGRLLEAFCADNMPQLVIAGASTLEAINALRRAYPKSTARWLGRISAPDVAPLYAAATLTIMPSLVEGFGLPLIESMACGTPTACSNVSSLPEVAGKASVLFDPTNLEDIRRAIRETIASPERLAELRGLGLERSKQYTFKRTTEGTWQAYEEFIEAYKNKHTN